MATIRKRVNKGKETYEVMYRDVSGALRSETKKTMKEAKDYRSFVENAIRTGNWIDPKLSRQKFGDYAKEWIEGELGGLKPATRLNYELLLRKHVLPSFKDAPIGHIEPKHVRKWVKQLDEGGMSPGSIRNAFRVLYRVLSVAEGDRVIASNPARGTKLPRRDKHEMNVLNPAQISKLAEAIEPRYRALILLAGWTGARWGEIAALEVKDLNLLKGEMKIRQSFSEVSGKIVVGSTKTHQKREVPLPKFLVDALSRHLDEFPSTGYVFTSPGGDELRKTFYLRFFKPALKAAGLPDIRFHDLRHSAATIALEELRASVTEVSKMLGHSSPIVTMGVYSHVLDKGLSSLRSGMEEAFDAIPLKEAK